jgi:GNAT superfamily N-acetyltransferase
MMITIKYREVSKETCTGLITAWIGNEQIGSLSFGWPARRAYRERYDVQLGQLRVLEDHRRKGAATMMMDEFYRHYDEQVVAPIELSGDGRKFWEAYKNRGGS